MNPLRIGLGTAVIVVVSVFVVLDQSANDHPLLRVRNAADTPVVLLADVGGGVTRDLGSLGAGESRAFRVRPEVARVFHARFTDGATVASAPLNLTPGQQLTFAVARSGWQPDDTARTTAR
ncbi:MAG: hypothetical protein V2J12_06660 [Gammaproteobacteria bacterium]|nr:hypothetical protein [Gammaproteobacteria bacterium]